MTADRALPAIYETDEIVEVGLDSYAGRTWHPARVIREEKAGGRDCVRVVWRGGGPGKVKGAVYWPPKEAVRRPEPPL